MSKRLIKYILEKTYRPLLLIYLSGKRSYRYKKLQLVIKPGVFHPGLFFSTKLLLLFLENIDVKNKNLLELGAGSGLISLESARRGAKVTATDISKTVIENIQENVLLNNLTIELIHSDLFDNLSNRTFDLIVINPPYYPHDPAKESEYAWFCGKDFEYFKKLFRQLKSHIHTDSEIYMILSEDCALEEIKTIASSNNFSMKEVYRKKIWWEENYIFMIRKNNTENL